MKFPVRKSRFTDIAAEADRTDAFHVKGPDGIVRGLNEHYDSQKDVEQDPYGAWLAIQNLWGDREELEANLAKAVEALKWIGVREAYIGASAKILRSHARMALAELEEEDNNE